MKAFFLLVTGNKISNSTPEVYEIFKGWGGGGWNGTSHKKGIQKLVCITPPDTAYPLFSLRITEVVKHDDASFSLSLYTKIFYFMANSDASLFRETSNSLILPVLRFGVV